MTPKQLVARHALMKLLASRPAEECQLTSG
jgi:hypothetical protein